MTEYLWCCVQGKCKAAREAYEQLIECPDIPAMLKANALRQLGKHQLLLLVNTGVLQSTER